MILNKRLLGYLVGVLALPAGHAFGQATITGSPTAAIYVDAVNGSDSNSGTQALPFRTIGAGVRAAETNNTKSIGTDVLINPGVYRELVTIQPSWKHTSAPMIYEAVQPGTAIVAASDEVTGWLPEGGNPNIYDTVWNSPLPACPIPSGWPSNVSPITLRAEMIFVNGEPLAQVLSFGTMHEGTFYIDSSAHFVKIWPSAQVDMNTALVESAARRQTLTVHSMPNTIIRGLVFRHAASCMNSHGLDVGSSTNLVLDNIRAEWNNWTGIAISRSNHITMQNSTSMHNGGVGFTGTQNLNIAYNGNETDYNNWRGAMGAFYDWGMGGTKFFTTQGATITNLISYSNEAQGLWFDTDHKNIVVDGATLSENLMGGLQVEANPGPINMNGSLVCSNGAGVNVLFTEGLKLTNNSFYNNSGTNHWQGQIFIGGGSGGRTITDVITKQTYTLYSRNMTFTGNTVEDASTGQYTFGTYMYLGSDWTQFTSTLKSDNNIFFDPLTPASFKIPGVKSNKPTTLQGWQSILGVDPNSVWATTPTLPASCVVPAPSYADFAATLDNRIYTMASGKTKAVINLKSYGYDVVHLSMRGLPAGVTASFDTNDLVSGVVNVYLTASSSAVRQTAPVTLFATSGSRVHPVTVSLNVVPGP